VDWTALMSLPSRFNRLADGRDVDAMIDRVVRQQAHPANIRRDIIERTDGISRFFVEEMTKGRIGGRRERRMKAQRTAAAVPSPALAVPARHCTPSLMARLDRLGLGEGK